MKVALVRVGIDSGSGGMQGPLFRDGSFEFIPIPDRSQTDERTYGNTRGRQGRFLAEYFPVPRRGAVAGLSMHVDPEFVTFTYGDPTPPKAGLRFLEAGDLLVFYCGLAGWGHPSPPALYLAGYFEVLMAGRGLDFSDREIRRHFHANFHVRHADIFDRQRETLVLVKGGRGSCLFERAALISATGRDRAGKPLKILSPEMQRIFGDFGGKLSIQRSPTRWVAPEFSESAAAFVHTLA